MPVKTPEEKALGDVEKAIKDYDKAVEKREVADKKAEEARAAEHRALRTLEWSARHPDLDDDFNLAEFQQSLQAPFDSETETTAIVADEETLAAISEGEAELAAAEDDDPQPVAEVEGDDPDDDDPFGEGSN